MSLRDHFIHTIPKHSATIAGLLTCAMAASSLTAQDAKQDTKEAAENEPELSSGDRPASAGRVVRAFDFEEQDYNPLPVPLGWLRGQEDPDVPRVRPGFPIWNGATIDYKATAFSGIGTARLPTAGGSTSLTLRHGEINIFPNADYLVSVRVRTDGLAHAKARVVARLLNGQGQPIDTAESFTPLVNTHGDWKQVSLEIEGVYQEAAFIQIELQLLQPEQQQLRGSTNRFMVWSQDFQGDAYFDNLIIAQLPRLEISTGQPGNIVASQDTPTINVLVRDLTGDAITARARIFDVHGQVVDQETLADGNRRVRSQWKPELPGYGWYRAVLEIMVDDQLVGARMLDFVWASPQAENTDSGMFSIFANLTDQRIAAAARALVEGSGVTRASVQLWAYETSVQDLEPESAQMQTLDQLVNLGTRLSIVLAELPQELATALAVDPDQVLPTFAGPKPSWIQWAGEMLDEYGQAVANWRFGNQPTQESSQTLNAQLTIINDALVGYVPGPVLTTSWPIDRPIEGALANSGRELLVVDHNASSEETMGIIVDDWFQSADSSGSSSLGMSLAPAHQVGTWSNVETWSAVGSLARKAISFWWEASSTGIDNHRFNLELKDAWWVSQGKRGQVMPAPELVVWRTLAMHLGGRKAIEQLDLVPGVRMLVAGPKSASTGDEKDGSGMMILWLDEPSIERTTLNLPLSMGPVTRHDIFNNQTAIEMQRIGELELPVHQVVVGRSPIIITGVNTQLVRLLSSIELTPDKLQAKSGLHEHAISISNPWPMTIRGQLYIVEPGGYTKSQSEIDRSWEINPRVLPFVLEPLQKKSLPISIAYSLGEIAGDKELVFDVELQADQDYPLIRIERTVELGLDAVEMALTAKKGADGITIVAARVTNKLDVMQDFEIVAISQNEPRLRRSINAIAPGEQVVREFALTKAKSGDQIIVTLLLREASSRLNKAVIVP